MAEVKLEQLRLDTLGTLEPRLEAVFQRHLASIAQDCINRPREKNKRKIVIEMTIEPVQDPETGECEHCNISVEARSKVPTHRTKSFQLAPSKAGFRFNSEVPENINQPGLFSKDE